MTMRITWWCRWPSAQRLQHVCRSKQGAHPPCSHACLRGAVAQRCCSSDTYAPHRLESADPSGGSPGVSAPVPALKLKLSAWVLAEVRGQSRGAAVCKVPRAYIWARSPGKNLTLPLGLVISGQWLSRAFVRPEGRHVMVLTAASPVPREGPGCRGAHGPHPFSRIHSLRFAPLHPNGSRGGSHVPVT